MTCCTPKSCWYCSLKDIPQKSAHGGFYRTKLAHSQGVVCNRGTWLGAAAAAAEALRGGLLVGGVAEDARGLLGTGSDCKKLSCACCCEARACCRAALGVSAGGVLGATKGLGPV